MRGDVGSDDLFPWMRSSLDPGLTSHCLNCEDFVISSGNSWPASSNWCLDLKAFARSWLVCSV